MPELTSLPVSASQDDIAEIMERDGAMILTGAMDDALLARVDAETQPLMAKSATGNDAFTGHNTTRTGALVARSPACREAVMNPVVLAAANRFLAPYCDRIQLHLTQLIRLLPGQGKQLLHRDRLAWGGYLPDIEPQFNTIWALTPFTAHNGATQVVPGSQKWDPQREAKPQEVCQAVMPRGSVLLYTGSVIHGGGENASTTPRIGMNITYCLGWLRTEENQYLSCPPDVARTLDADLQELLGYTMGSYALGYFSPPQPSPDIPDTAPPELALGRLPRAAPTAKKIAEKAGGDVGSFVPVAGGQSGLRG